MARLIVVDESLDSRLVTHLAKRGRAAKSYNDLGFRGLEDPVMIRDYLSKIQEPWVLVTGDDFMPYEHAVTLASINATVATIDGDWEQLCAKKGVVLNPEAFKVEAVHRWAHVISEMDQGTIRRFNPWRHSIWRPKSRHIRRMMAIAAEPTDV